MSPNGDFFNAYSQASPNFAVIDVSLTGHHDFRRFFQTLCGQAIFNVDAFQFFDLLKSSLLLARLFT